MGPTFRIAIAEDEFITRSYLEETLTARGHVIVCSVSSGAELIDRCRVECPDLVITDIKLPAVDGLAAVQEICRNGPVPVIFLTGYDNIEQAAAAAQQCGVFLYLVKPIDASVLGRALDLLMLRYNQFRSLVGNDADVNEALAQWPVIQRAKDLLMGGQGLDDRDAFDQLQTLARRKGLSLADVARDVLAWEKGD